jgi:hypothetical protein
LDAVAHCLQMQDRLRSASGTRASTAGSNVTSLHQHGVEKSMLRALTHPFGPPHSGQVRFGFGAAWSWLVMKAQ